MTAFVIGDALSFDLTARRDESTGSVAGALWRGFGASIWLLLLYRRARAVHDAGRRWMAAALGPRVGGTVAGGAFGIVAALCAFGPLTRYYSG